MRRFVLWFAVVGLFLYWYHYRHGHVPAAVPDGLFTGIPIEPNDAPDTCFGKVRCVIVYVAPWCPTCHASIPFIAAAARETAGSIEAGIKVVIGSDEPRQLRRMAAQIGLPAYIDERGVFGEKMNVEAFPTWIITDQKGNVVRRFAAGAPDVSADGHPELVVRDFLSEVGITLEPLPPVSPRVS